MAFSEDVVKQAWDRAGGKCECTRTIHGNHTSRCAKILTWQNRGRRGESAWEANHINRQESGGHDGLTNCEILCWDCHEQTL